MSHLLKVIISVAAFFAILTVIANVLPDGITSSINSSVVYFLNLMVTSLSNLVHVSVLLTCLKILFNMTFGIATAYMVFVIVHMIL